MDEAVVHEGKGNSHPKQEAFLGWQNACSTFLSSSTLNICRVNSATPALLPSPWWGGGPKHGFPTPLGTTARYHRCILREEGFARKEKTTQARESAVAETESITVKSQPPTLKTWFQVLKKKRLPFTVTKNKTDQKKPQKQKTPQEYTLDSIS